MRLPLLLPAVSKLERADYPEVTGMKTDNMPTAVQDAAIASPRASQRDCNDIPLRGYAVARRGEYCFFNHRSKSYTRLSSTAMFRFGNLCG